MDDTTEDELFKQTMEAIAKLNAISVKIDKEIDNINKEIYNIKRML